MQHSEGFLEIVNASKSRIRETTPEEVRPRQEAGEKFHFIDVREDHEWQKGHATEAVPTHWPVQPQTWMSET